MARLTNRERDAVCAVLDEFLAGHDAEMVRAVGLCNTEKEGARMLSRLGSARAKLTVISAPSPESATNG